MQNVVNSLEYAQNQTYQLSTHRIAVANQRSRAAVTPTDKSERDALALENLPLVRQVAKRLQNRLPSHIELNDLESAGLLGLLDAARKFDLSRKIQFSSYAQFRIRGSMLDFLRTLDWTPRDLRCKGRAVRETTQVLSAELGREPLVSEIADGMKLPLAELQTMTSSLSGVKLLSLDSEQGHDGEPSLGETIASLGVCPLELNIQRQRREHLTAAIEALPERERLVLTLCFFEELTLKEVGVVLGVVESRVSQIRASALKRLKRAMETERSGQALTCSARSSQALKMTAKDFRVTADKRRRGNRNHGECQL